MHGLTIIFQAAFNVEVWDNKLILDFFSQAWPHLWLWQKLPRCHSSSCTVVKQIKGKNKASSSLKQSRKEKLHTIFFSALAIPASGKADWKAVTETSLTAFYANLPSHVFFLWENMGTIDAFALKPEAFRGRIENWKYSNICHKNI